MSRVLRDHPGRSYRNPIIQAQEWQKMLESAECANRAALARKFGVSRARVSQVLGLLALAPEAIDALVALGDPVSRPIVSERTLRPLVKVPPEEQLRVIRRTTHSLA